MKTRTWRCPCCRACWSRRKNERSGGRCPTCRLELQAGQTWTERRDSCRHSRGRAKMAAWKERRWMAPRTRLGFVLRPSAPLRAAWRDVRAARTRPALVRRGQAWLEALMAEVRDEDTRPEAWSQYATLKDGHFEVHRHRGGMTGVPVIALDPRMGGSFHGEYSRSLWKGVHQIRLNPEPNHDGDRLDEIRRTLVHEALHCIDGDTHVDDEAHGRRWSARLARMEVLFPPEAR